MKKFISKWSNWWILNKERKELDDAFEKELNELIEREVTLRKTDVSSSNTSKTEIMKKYFRKEKPNKDQIIGFKAMKRIYPEIGVFQIFNNGIEKVYIPANDDEEQLINIDYWFEVPQK